MEVFVIIDEDGKIVETNVSPFFQEEQYFFAVKDFNSKNYTDSLIGRTDEIISNNLFDKGNELYITGATCSTNGLKNAYKDAFNVFNNLKGGNN